VRLGCMYEVPGVPRSSSSLASLQRTYTSRPSLECTLVVARAFLDFDIFLRRSYIFLRGHS
jgi:hypothetical protein